MKIKALYVLAALVFAALVAQKFDLRYGFSELAGFGQTYLFPKIEALEGIDYYAKPNSGGYDGQFYAQIALDPSLRADGLDQAIDGPSYRARRILLPALAYALGFGRPEAVLQIYCLLNILCWIAVAWLLLHWAPPVSIENFGRWFFCLFSMGALESVRYSLVDLPSLALMLGTIRLLDTERFKSAAFVQAAATLTKETALLNVATVLRLTPNGRFPFVQNIRRGGLALGLSCAVFGLWMLYVAQVFPVVGQVPGAMGIPFLGLAEGVYQAGAELLAGNISTRFAFRIAAALGLAYQCWYLWRHRDFGNRIWVMGALFSVLFVTLGPKVWWGYWAACRVALPLTFAFNLLLDSRRKTFFWSALVLSNLAFIHGIDRWF